MDNNQPVDFFIEEGILFGTLKTSLSLDVNTLKKIIEEREKICNGKAYPVLYEFNNLEHIGPDARNHMNINNTKWMLAAAFYSKNKDIAILINVIMTINQPEIPVKVFTNKEKAIEWLKQFVKKDC